MKFIAVYPSESRDQAGMKILVWPDSAMVRTGRPVFVADEGSSRVLVGVAAKITAVGKSIEPRFASRYYEEVAPMAFIVKEEVAERLDKGIDPAACDIVADCSVVCGDTVSPDLGGVKEMNVICRSLLHGGETETKRGYPTEGLDRRLADAIATASRANTLKTGDYVAFLLPGHFPAEPDSVVRMTLDDRILLENKLK